MEVVKQLGSAEVSFFGRTGGLGVSPNLKNPPRLGGFRGLKRVVKCSHERPFYRLKANRFNGVDEIIIGAGFKPAPTFMLNLIKRKRASLILALAAGQSCLPAAGTLSY
jgi:hypothetical protein